MSTQPIDFDAPAAGSANAGWISALPDFAIAATFLITWVRPAWGGPGLVSHLLLVMLLEFIIMHSSGFMGMAATADTSRMKRVGALLGLGLFYSLFAGAFSFAFHTWWPIAAFWGLMANRLLGVMLGQAPADQQRDFVVSSWAASGVFYLLFCFVTVILPIPRFAITQEFVAGLHLTGGGLWIDQPHRVLAFGALYFTAMGCSELVSHRWFANAKVGRSS